MRENWFGRVCKWCNREWVTLCEGFKLSELFNRQMFLVNLKFLLIYWAFRYQTFCVTSFTIDSQVRRQKNVFIPLLPSPPRLALTLNGSSRLSYIAKVLIQSSELFSAEHTSLHRPFGFFFFQLKGSPYCVANNGGWKKVSFSFHRCKELTWAN